MLFCSSVRAVPVPDHPHAGAGHQCGRDGHHVSGDASGLHRHATSRWYAGRQDWQLQSKCTQ